MTASNPQSGRVIFIVGASSGIGEGIARSLAKDCPDIKLVVGARRVDRLEKLVGELGLKDSKAIAIDVTKREQVQSAYAQIQSTYGQGPDVVINVAGNMYFQLLKNQAWDDWERQIDVNCKGVTFSCGAAFKIMLDDIKSDKSAGQKPKLKHIINISSDAARQTFPALTIYNASKNYVREFTKGLRCESVGTGIKVTDIQPGDVRTGLILDNTDKEAGEKVGVSIGKQIGGGADADIDDCDRPSYLDPEDIGNAVLYALKSPAHVGIHELLVEPRDQMFGDPTSLAIGA